MLNTSDNDTGCEPQTLHIFIPSFLSFVFFCGFVLNCLSLYIFWFRIKQWNSTMMLQFNLAIADAIITPAAPLIIIYSLTDDWTFGTFLCQVKVFSLSAHMYGSIYFLTLISLHRYFTVVHNVRRTVFTRNSFIKKVCLVVWGCLFCQGLPFFFILKTTEIHGTTKCLSFHQTDMAVLYFLWNWVIIFTGLFIPFGITITCYTLLIRYILKINPMNSVSKVMKSKSIQTISISLVIFIICYVPVHITRTMGVTVKLFFPLYCGLLERVEVAYYITWMLSGTNCCLDPILYCFGSEKFKYAFTNSFNFLPCLRKSHLSGSDDSAQGTHAGESGTGAASVDSHGPVVTENTVSTMVSISTGVEWETHHD
uniref:Lysophosphatidic acid receptor 6-like n=1 Tax=Geotrypetes seraphini TaxID=260995 RepID=A0A6P8SGR5_GEOSA|nr:lysophosphatidic acid receptor 6-like [Geotrypetes seraphini]